MSYPDILNKTHFNREDIIRLLNAEGEEVLLLKKKAKEVLIKECGNEIYLRGLIEISNACDFDCYYCGLRKSNQDLERYYLSQEEIIDTAQLCARKGFGSLVLQCGQNSNPEFVGFIEKVIIDIKQATTSKLLPNGLGITLSFGEQNMQTYKRWLEAGAHRYLLRIEASNPQLFAKIHPPYQKYEHRLHCIRHLNQNGWQAGSGVMIGIPGQTIEDLADDILFFKNENIGMLGMGPYLLHPDTPMFSNIDWWNNNTKEIATLALKMIATTRIVLKDVNIASTTALETIMPNGRELGLEHGANVYMPLLTPESKRELYGIYSGKPASDTKLVCPADRRIAFNEWGDAKHYKRKHN